MCDGGERHDWCEYVHEENTKPDSIWWVGGRRLSESQIYRYSQKAWKLIAETTRGSRKRLLKRHLAQRKNLVAKSIAAGDLRTALAAMESEARLLGLFEPPSKATKGDAPATNADLVKLLANRLKEIEASELPASERVRLTTALASSLMTAIGADVIQGQLAELLDKLESEESKRKGNR
jgi:hypothetical protein